MGDNWIPDDILQIKPVLANITENPTTVQFDHRIMVIILKIYNFTKSVFLNYLTNFTGNKYCFNFISFIHYVS